MEVRQRKTIWQFSRVSSPIVNDTAEARKIQNSAWTQKSLREMNANTFNLVPGSTACMLFRLTQACGPYQAIQSARSNSRVARTITPKRMRNNAIGMGDCSAKKNAFQASKKDFAFTASPQASRRSCKKRARPKARAQMYRRG